MSVGLQRLREEPDVLRRGAVDKGEDPSVVDRALELDERRRALLSEGDGLKSERNAASKRIGEAIKTFNFKWSRRVLRSGGQFPTSIAVSGDLVYVLNAGMPNSVTTLELESDGTLSPSGAPPHPLSWPRKNLSGEHP